MASLLLPYLEGYSIAGEALPQAKRESARLLADLCLAIGRAPQPESLEPI